ncbi:4Fe-4S dicluster domain-containing protein [Parvibacter caecicola]|uniref:4Fe-4S dicluster domain-containing protein n=1 Tax=Parvibacter caecicola TaxID=747645 RepID=UPI00249AFF60|nr:4Fe-4S dicluster domain-containing protein [Parvibacter caecicola]
MTQYAIAVDVNRCVACMACNGACKMVNNVPIGSFWNKVLRIGPQEAAEGGAKPARDFYYLPIQCQHCENPACVAVCPTEASHKLADGTVQIDKEKCIGCQFCAMACPYGVRYLNEEERVVEKCTLCEQQIAQGELPQCVTNCVGMAKWFGDLEQGVGSFRGVRGETIDSFCEPYTEADLHALPDVGNKPTFVYILRNHTWQGGE